MVTQIDKLFHMIIVNGALSVRLELESNSASVKGRLQQLSAL